MSTSFWYMLRKRPDTEIFIKERFIPREKWGCGHHIIYLFAFHLLDASALVNYGAWEI